MRLFISLSGAVVLTAAVLTACNSSDGSGSKRNTGASVASTTTNANTAANASGPATASTPQGDNVQRVTTVELRDLVAKGQAVVLDVRSQEAYDAAHIKGAIHIAEMNIPTQAAQKLPRDKMIVTYCS